MVAEARTAALHLVVNICASGSTSRDDETIRIMMPWILPFKLRLIVAHGPRHGDQDLKSLRDKIGISEFFILTWHIDSDTKHILLLDELPG